MLIAEGGLSGEDEGVAVGFFYQMPEDEAGIPMVNDEPIYIGPAPNFMAFLVDSNEDDTGEDDPDTFDDFDDEVESSRE